MRALKQMALIFTPPPRPTAAASPRVPRVPLLVGRRVSNVSVICVIGVICGYFKHSSLAVARGAEADAVDSEGRVLRFARTMAAGTYAQVLGERGFKAFLWTQFLGAFNDNVCRLVISMVALAAAGATGTASGHLPWVTAVFALPFLLFSGYAGQLADTHSKRTVLVVTTALEVVAMAVGIVAFMNGRLEWMLVVLFLIATQSAFFGPAKYGIVPGDRARVCAVAG